MFASAALCANCHDIATAEQRISIHPDCLTCHTSSKTAVIDTINAGKAGTQVNCESCHSGGAGSAITHGTTPATAAPVHDMFASAALCANCHDIATAEQRISIHPDCLTCHTSSKTAVIDTINAGKAGTQIDCQNCHSGPPMLFHHQTLAAQTGWCINCHVPPASASDVPPQAACRQCHIDENGFVYRPGNPPIHDYNTQGAIKHFGACFACHAPVPYHARPTVRPEWWDTAPGKGSFNLFYGDYHRPGTRYYRRDRRPSPVPGYSTMWDLGKNFLRYDRGKEWQTPAINYSMVTIIHNGQVYTVPAFDEAN